jgi:MarR family transcriptional regulator, transcriptional regulator for hemolysin
LSRQPFLTAAANPSGVSGKPRRVPPTRSFARRCHRFHLANAFWRSGPLPKRENRNTAALLMVLAISASLGRRNCHAYNKRTYYIAHMSDPSFDRSFGFLLHDIARLMGKRFEQRARPLGLSRAQWRALAHLQRSEGVNQSRLAELLELEPISVARLIDRMEQAGLVERRKDPADRRAHRLYLTSRAGPLLQQGRVLGDAVRAEAFASFSESERETVTDLLVRIRSNLSDGRREGQARQRPNAPGDRLGTAS